MKNIVAFGEVLMDCLPDKNVIGGAPFNVAIHLKRFGNQVTFVSQIAKDDFGNEIYDYIFPIFWLIFLWRIYPHYFRRVF